MKFQYCLLVALQAFLIQTPCDASFCGSPAPKPALGLPYGYGQAAVPTLVPEWQFTAPTAVETLVPEWAMTPATISPALVPEWQLFGHNAVETLVPEWQLNPAHAVPALVPEWQITAPTAVPTLVPEWQYPVPAPFPAFIPEYPVAAPVRPAYNSAQLVSNIVAPGYPYNTLNDVKVVGELPVRGAATVTGAVPVSGAVQFAGNVPATGAVSVKCSCGDYNGYGYGYETGIYY